MTNRLDGGLADQLEKLLAEATPGEVELIEDDEVGLWAGENCVAQMKSIGAHWRRMCDGKLFQFLRNNAPVFLSALRSPPISESGEAESALDRLREIANSSDDVGVRASLKALAIFFTRLVRDGERMWAEIEDLRQVNVNLVAETTAALDAKHEALDRADAAETQAAALKLDLTAIRNLAANWANSPDFNPTLTEIGERANEALGRAALQPERAGKP